MARMSVDDLLTVDNQYANVARDLCSLHALTIGIP